MKLERLESIAEIVAGQSPSSDSYNQIGDGLPFFQGKADFGEMFPIARYWCNEPTKIALPDDILMSVRAPVGPVNICNSESCIGRGLSAIRVNRMNSNKYIYYFLKANEKQISNLGVGSTFKAITQKEIRGLLIPIPEKLEDQINIANILSKAEILIKQRKESIDLLDVFLKSTFLKMFGDPVRNQKGWEICRLGDVCDFENGDRSSNYPSGDEIVEDGIIFVNSGNIIDFRFQPINPNFITEVKFNSLRSGKCKSGDILFTLRGNGLGKCCVFSKYEKGFVNAQIVIIRPVRQVNNYFLIEQFRNTSLFQNIWKLQSGSAQPQLSVSQLKNLQIITPPIELQTKFADIIEKTETLKEQYRLSLSELKNLYGSISKKAFKGELNLYGLKITDELKKTNPIEVNVNQQVISPEINRIVETANYVQKTVAKQTEYLQQILEYTKQFEQFEKFVAPEIEAANEFQKIFTTKSDYIQQVTKITKQFEEFEKFIAPIKNLPQIPPAVVEAQNAFARIKTFLPKEYFIQERIIKNKITWDKVSPQQAANWIKGRYKGYHFNSEMLIRFLMNEYITSPIYYSSEEQKKNPSSNDAYDLKKLISSSVSDENPFLKMEQVFYDAEKENIQFKITEEDYDLIKDLSPTERSGIYFNIIE